MEIRRFFVKKEDINGKIVTLSGDEFVHAVKVLRQKVGYKIIVCCGDGFDYQAEITEITKTFLTAQIVFCEQNFNTPKKRITLYQGSCKLGKNDFIVQKAVELGVTSVVFFDSKNVSDNKVNIERLQKISIEASKQCGRSDIVGVDFCKFTDIFDKVHSNNTIMFYEEESENFIDDFDFSNIQNVNIIIGSEGGFDKSEAQLAQQKGIKLLSLGSRILRAETASVVACTLVQDRIGGLK